ncbi:hypothetical protein GQS65_13055 [Halomarina oriensis]|uniref:Uncharacterized protein n=1 Tax=Halomarina oriensis TaxID=671145 RepID=A0A6B0GN82_9EURY|nr:hypothetical protein [Halomarina oriensis]
MDVAHVRYGSAVPTLVRTLSGAYDYLLTPIPQTGDVLLHRTSFDSEVAEVLSALETAFPERRELTDEESALIGSVLGHPESALEHRRTHNQSQTAGLTDERIAHLFDSGAINEDDVFALQFVEWLPAPTDEAVHEAIAEGTTRIESLSRFDERHDVMLARSVFASIHEQDGYARNRL